MAPLIMVFFQQESKIKLRIQLLESIERYIFFGYLVRLRHQYYMDFDPYMFLELSSQLTKKKISPQKVIEIIGDRLDKNKKDKQLLTNIKGSFKRNGFYNWKGIKYFMYEYDLHLKSQSKTSREKIAWDSYIEDSTDHHTIEHIYPQHPRKYCWTSVYGKFTSKERNALRHSLGNLVPLSRAKNSSFQNNCFENKLGSECNKVGFRYGSYAENEIACKSTWTANDILERGLKLLTFMEKRWGITVGDNSEKIKFLNLSFVPKKYENITSSSNRHAKGTRS